MQFYFAQVKIFFKNFFSALSGIKTFQNNSKKYLQKLVNKSFELFFRILQLLFFVFLLIFADKINADLPVLL